LCAVRDVRIVGNGDHRSFVGKARTDEPGSWMTFVRPQRHSTFSPVKGYACVDPIVP